MEDSGGWVQIEHRGCVLSGRHVVGGIDLSAILAELCAVIPNLCLAYSLALGSTGNQMNCAGDRSSVSWSRYDDAVRWTIRPVVGLKEFGHRRGILRGAGTRRQTHGD